MSDIAKRLRASVGMDAINGDSFERSVCGRQMVEAAIYIATLGHRIAELEQAAGKKDIQCGYLERELDAYVESGKRLSIERAEFRIRAEKAESRIAELESTIPQWQPIETAPIGESVFVFCPIHGRYLAYREQVGDSDFTQWCNWNGERGLLPPTHWMPMPEPPQ